MTRILSQIDTNALPAPYDSERARVACDEWQSTIAEQGGSDQTLRAAAADPKAHALIQAICGNSPYLAQTIHRDPLFFGKVLTEPLENLQLEIQEEVAALVLDPPGVNDLMQRLRRAKTRMALLVATADIAGLWSLEHIMHTLSDFAAATTQAAVTRLLADAFDAGELTAPEGVDSLAGRVENSGYTVLAMGKLGARELNYSSDIDLIVLFDASAVTYTGRKSMQDCFIRMTRELVRILNERTADGYVFRVDLRLRPDARATPLAISMDAAEIYYQSTGVNWERAAMIKARPIAGDITAGRDFLDRIKAFVWRKYLDYAAVQDIQDIKGKIHSHHRHEGVTFAGQDVKLGYGGIREVEFFAQIYQLIMGGREHALRVPDTLGAIDALAEGGFISREEEEALATAYRYLRRLEHRLQMVKDEQTHQLPETPDELTHIACFMGYDDAEAMRTELLALMQRVHSIYADLSKEAAGEDETAPTSESAWDAFKEPEKAQGLVDAWISGRYRACRTERARTILKGLAPKIVHALAEAPDPDTALLRLDEFLAKLPAGIQLFSLFQAHPWLLDLVIEIMGSAPALADRLGRNVLLLDSVLDPDFFSPLPAPDILAAELEDVLARAEHYEEVLDLTRRWANDRKFQIGVQMLRQLVTADEAGAQLTRVAEVAMRALYPRVLSEFEAAHGPIAGDMVILGLGKLGAEALTFQSDLDLIFLYECGAETSRGPRPLPASQYFARLGQRYINAISALTAEGRLFEVDMRLRPSGHAGPIAVGLDTFVEYQNAKAWTWERMALTRARSIIGRPELRDKVDAAVADILRQPRDPAALLRHVADMRRRLESEFGTRDIWSVKFVRGGLLDIEFIVQYFTLKTLPEHRYHPSPRLSDSLEKLMELGAISAGNGQYLQEALALQQNVQSFLRLCCGGGFDERTAGSALQNSLARYCAQKDFKTLKRRLIETQAAVFGIFRELVIVPAEALPPEGAAS